MSQIRPRVPKAAAQAARVGKAILPHAMALYVAVYLFAPQVTADRAIYVNPAALVVCTVLVGAALATDGGPAFRLLSSRIAFWLGEVSLGIYLLHRPSAFFAGLVVDADAGWPHWALSLALTLALAQIAFLVIETPMRRDIRRLGEGDTRPQEGPGEGCGDLSAASRGASPLEGAAPPR